MSHSINRQYIHFVWSTKNLEPLIAKNLSNFEDPLRGYLWGTLKKLGGILLANTNTKDHVHLLAHVPTDLSIAEFIRQIKSCSSKWYRTIDLEFSTFAWNEGYSAFSVSPTSIEKIKNYMSQDENRHRKLPFEEELMGFLNFHEINFNPKFVTNTTYSKLFYHLVWSVKSRKSLLHNSIQELLHQHTQQEMLKIGGKLHAIGNVADHIHLLVECTAKVPMASIVQNLKTSTTHLIKSQSRIFDCFSWQEGYGVFSVGKPAFETVFNYVNNQEEHHRHKSFEEEWNLLKGFDAII